MQKNGFSAGSLKWIALIMMTLDHIGLWCSLMDLRSLGMPLRILGRIAAPVFLFLMTESLRYTRSRPKLLLRLYLGAVLHGGVSTALISLTGESAWYGNIFPTLFYVALIVTAFDGLKDRKPQFFLLLTGMTAAGAFLAPRFPFLPLLFPHLPDVEYSALFVLLGVLWYYLPKRTVQTGLLLLLSAASLLVSPYDPLIRALRFSPMFYGSQWCMVFAAPFLLFYNGAKGRSPRSFFYWYYPLHQYALLFFAMLIKNA